MAEIDLTNIKEKIVLGDGKINVSSGFLVGENSMVLCFQDEESKGQVGEDLTETILKFCPHTMIVFKNRESFKVFEKAITPIREHFK